MIRYLCSLKKRNEMTLSIIWLIVGLGAILAGANLLTDGSAAIARKFGLSDLVVGLTVVAFGTSTPELAISMISAASGNAPLAVGNVVGSNIFNILVIIGITALVRPIIIEKSVMTNEIPMVLLSSIILLVLGSQSLLQSGAADAVSRAEGIFLIIFFLLFMRYTLSQAHSGEPSGGDAPKAVMGIGKATLWVLLGLAGLVWGGDRFVDGATGVARGLGISDAVIGLTIVAAGTSLPELAASVVAAVKNMPGLAVGNVIGSNIFNVLLVLGASSVVLPLPFGEVGLPDLLTLLLASVLFLVFGWFFGERKITRVEGAILFGVYVAYTVMLVVNL